MEAADRLMSNHLRLSRLRTSKPTVRWSVGLQVVSDPSQAAAFGTVKNYPPTMSTAKSSRNFLPERRAHEHDANSFKDETLNWEANNMRFPNSEAATELVRREYAPGHAIKDL